MLCDRRAGIGADGVLRVVARAAGRRARRRAWGSGRPEWFMDYRNADGSVAEMCGNGVRVFARYLLDQRAGRRPGFHRRHPGRGAARSGREPDGRFTVDMGPARVLGKGRP